MRSHLGMRARLAWLAGPFWLSLARIWGALGGFLAPRFLTSTLCFLDSGRLRSLWSARLSRAKHIPAFLFRWGKPYIAKLGRETRHLNLGEGAEVLLSLAAGALLWGLWMVGFASISIRSLGAGLVQYPPPGVTVRWSPPPERHMQRSMAASWPDCLRGGPPFGKLSGGN